MVFCFELLWRSTVSSWISVTLLCSMMFTWTSVDCWSYFYSDTTMNWEQARAWCRANYTDMVAIQNQKEIEHLNSWLPMKSRYYWIGIRKIDNIWTWVGTNKPLTLEATNWAVGEPNNGKKLGGQEDCVEMYVKRNVEAGKWNDERCTKPKTALCYTAACKKGLCLHGDCVETINSHKCECFEGFYGEKCEHVVKCHKDNVTDPDNGSVHCSHTYGEFSYNSTCEYACEKSHKLSMSAPLRCTAAAEWSEQPPSCELVQCPKLTQPAGGAMVCSDPRGPFSYQSTCVFTCDEGYKIADSLSNTLHCDESGSWNVSEPFCVAVQCPALHELENGFVNCGEDADFQFTYKNTCNFGCAPRYRLVGPSAVTCTSAATWSEGKPRCEAITCQKPEEKAHLIVQCNKSLTELRPDAACSFSCETGFELQGAHSIQCTEDGEWTEAIPTCKVVECPVLEDPENGRINCSLPEPVYSSQCSFTCNPDYSLDGHELLTCDGRGNWTEERPICRASPSQIINIVSGAATGATLLSGLSVALWLLKRLKQKATKFELNSTSDIEAPTEVYKRSIDSLI